MEIIRPLLPPLGSPIGPCRDDSADSTQSQPQQQDQRRDRETAASRIAAVRCNAFHEGRVLLAAGAVVRVVEDCVPGSQAREYHSLSTAPSFRINGRKRTVRQLRSV